jgi:thiol-disulfide isomerase/thioredoxin
MCLYWVAWHNHGLLTFGNYGGVWMKFTDGIIVVVKKDCPTCLLIAPVLKELEQAGKTISVYYQDASDFLSVANVIDDRELEASYRLNIETVPTLVTFSGGEESGRLIGWAREEWRTSLGLESLGEGLPDWRPGCGSRSVEPEIVEILEAKFGNFDFAVRKISLPALVDDIEHCFESGWTDGLPVVPPTQERVLRMLKGTSRAADEVLGILPPYFVKCTVSKVAINAVLAGCKPEYFPVVLASIEAALDPAFCLHGLLATTWFSGPMAIVNGPIRSDINMNWGGNVLGQGNRANATIGRALQLTVRNVGGGEPQKTDQSAFGSPVKYGFCFAEDENTPWTTLSEERGLERNVSAVTLFSADGPIGCVDQSSREPEGLIYSLAGTLKGINHIDMANASDAVVVIGPEHGRVFDNAGWSKERTVGALQTALLIRGKSLGMGTDPEVEKNEHSGQSEKIAKFRKGGLTLVRAGGQAGLFSAIIPGWIMKGAPGTDPVTKEIKL